MTSIANIVKSARKIMRQDTGTASDELRILQLGWMLFLKIFSDKDKELELLTSDYVSPIPAKFHWDQWAGNDEGIKVLVAPQNGVCTSEILPLPIFADMNAHYLVYALKSRHFLNYAAQKVRGMKMPRLSTNDGRKALIPLPPVEEQNAIVEKVQRLLRLCEGLEEQIAQAHANALQLSQAVLQETLSADATNPVINDNVVDLKARENNATPHYKRTLLAAEVVHQMHNEPTFGHLKLQKIIYLCQKTQNMELATNFLKQAAGPYDPEMQRSLDLYFVEHEWFSYSQSRRLKYQRLRNAGSHKTDFKKYFHEHLKSIGHLITLFKQRKSNELEAIATLYACWESILNSELAFSKSLLIEKFYKWSEEKRKFSERQLIQAITWMEKNKVVPQKNKSTLQLFSE